MLNNAQDSAVETAKPDAADIADFSAVRSSAVDDVLDSAIRNLRAPCPTPIHADIPASTPQDHLDSTHTQWDALLQRPMSHMGNSEATLNDTFTYPGTFCFPFPFGPSMSKQDILSLLPPEHCCDCLVTEYFLRLSPLFHILHGPTFQKQYNAFRRDPTRADLSWIALLFAICSATMNTLEGNDSILVDIWRDISGVPDIPSATYRFRTAAMICLSQDQFLIRHSLNTLEALLLLIYTISNHEGAERAWTLLGLTLNIAIALKCNVEPEAPQLSCIDTQRRRRCWAGVLLLHTYQATFFRDIDMSNLLNIEATMPADVNDNDIKDDSIAPPSTQPTQMSVMKFKIEMFQLSTKICRHLSSSSKHDEAVLSIFDSQIAEEQRQWDNTFLLDGFASLLDPSSYAHWCILQLYAHQLYLLLHRPFCKPHSSYFRSASRAKCIMSGTALLDVHRQLCELPRLRHYRWLSSGLTSFYAIHGAIALASCLLDEPVTVDLSPYRSDFDAAVSRIYALQNKSQICAKAYPILQYIQTLLSTERTQPTRQVDHDFGTTFDAWIDGVQWMIPDSIDWAFWDTILNNDADSVGDDGEGGLNVDDLIT
ncbi:hypothetical protein AbraIFM66950_000561 [Aspergillus brasiliensis]|nr:hypothetical protein AbraIFM66950_000561 [Aspergillus brasiliensis]